MLPIPNEIQVSLLIRGEGFAPESTGHIFFLFAIRELKSLKERTIKQTTALTQCLQAWISSGFSFLRFTGLLVSVDLCLLSNLESFQPLFFKHFFLLRLLNTIRHFGFVPQIPKILFTFSFYFLLFSLDNF